LSQEADTPVDLAQLALAVDVFGVLRAIALRRGLLHGLRDLRAQHAPKVIQFLFQPRRALRSDELRAARLRCAVSRHVSGFAKRRSGDA
jgi:hypothetical protein